MTASSRLGIAFGVIGSVILLGILFYIYFHNTGRSTPPSKSSGSASSPPSDGDYQHPIDLRPQPPPPLHPPGPPRDPDPERPPGPLGPPPPRDPDPRRPLRDPDPLRLLRDPDPQRPLRDPDPQRPQEPLPIMLQVPRSPRRQSGRNQRQSAWD